MCEGQTYYVRCVLSAFAILFFPFAFLHPRLRAVPRIDTFVVKCRCAEGKKLFISIKFRSDSQWIEEKKEKMVKQKKYLRWWKVEAMKCEFCCHHKHHNRCENENAIILLFSNSIVGAKWWLWSAKRKFLGALHTRLLAPTSNWMSERMERRIRELQQFVLAIKICMCRRSEQMVWLMIGFVIFNIKKEHHTCF